MSESQLSADPAQRTVIEAIVRRLQVTAIYNGAEMLLAPHQLFERHGELFLGAFNLRKTWRSEDERRLGNFKLDGLSGVRLVEEPFDPLPAELTPLPRESDKLILAV